MPKYNNGYIWFGIVLVVIMTLHNRGDNLEEVNYFNGYNGLVSRLQQWS